jgi:hypothetical protein
MHSYQIIIDDSYCGLYRDYELIYESESIDPQLIQILTGEFPEVVYIMDLDEGTFKEVDVDGEVCFEIKGTIYWMDNKGFVPQWPFKE